MSYLDKQTIEKLTQLNRIHCSEEDQANLLADLKKILDYADALQELDTSNVEPCNNVVKGMVNCFRDDEIGETRCHKTLIDNAPDKIGGMIRIPTVIKNR